MLSLFAWLPHSPCHALSLFAYCSPCSHTTASHTINTHWSSHSRTCISSHYRQGISRHFYITPPRVPSRVSPVPVYTGKQHKHTTHIERPHEVSLSAVSPESSSFLMGKLRLKAKFTFNPPTHSQANEAILGATKHTPQTSTSSHSTHQSMLGAISRSVMHTHPSTVVQPNRQTDRQTDRQRDI